MIILGKISAVVAFLFVMGLLVCVFAGDAFPDRIAEGCYTGAVIFAITGCALMFAANWKDL